MKKIKYIIFIASLVAGAGLTYAIITLKNLPDAFDWNLEEDEDDF